MKLAKQHAEEPTEEQKIAQEEYESVCNALARFMVRAHLNDYPLPIVRAALICQLETERYVVTASGVQTAEEFDARDAELVRKLREGLPAQFEKAKKELEEKSSTRGDMDQKTKVRILMRDCWMLGYIAALEERNFPSPPDSAELRAKAEKFVRRRTAGL